MKMSQEPRELSISEKAQIEVNRQKALLIRAEKLNKRKLNAIDDKSNNDKKVIRIDNSEFIDSGAGFFIQEEEQRAPEAPPSPVLPPILPSDQSSCEVCAKRFATSYLHQHFDESVCDACHDKEKHCLITKTDAKNLYLLKDHDMDSREPKLKFILKKNPHNHR